MNRITHPLTPGMDGPALTDLQDALIALLDRAAILPASPDDRRALAEAITRERGKYGDVTAKAVSVLQDEAGLKASGAVDADTAARLNALLQGFGLLGGDAAPAQRMIVGVVSAEGGLPRGLTVLAYAQTTVGGVAGPVRLGQDQVDATGGYVIRHDPTPAPDRLAKTGLTMVVVDASGQELLRSRHRPATTAVQRINLTLPAPAMPGAVLGRAGSRSQPAPAGIELHLFDVNPGDQMVELATGLTGPDGSYRLDYARPLAVQGGKDRPDLLLRAVSDGRVIAESAIRFDARPEETIDLILPEDEVAGPAEFTLLESALKRQQVTRLRDMGAKDPARELAYLAGKTGWDARAVALAALSDQFSADHADGDQALAPALYYALFRAGLPADPTALYATDPARVDAAWQAAEAAGVIPPRDAAARKRDLARFRAIAAPRALDIRAAEGISTLRELIGRTLTKPQEQQAFARLRDSHRGDAPGFWAATEREFGRDRAAALKLDGQLSGFALRDAGLVGRLHKAAAIAAPSDLARQGYFSADAWLPLLDEIPASVTGEDGGDRRTRAAELLAAQVRLAYPTLSLARQIETGTMPVRWPDRIGKFLATHHADFTLGSQPVAQFAARAGIDLPPTTGAEIERLQRVHQITRDDNGMARMLARGFDSAASVARMSPSQFVAEMGDDLGGTDAALATHAKASQIHATVLSLATAWIGAAQAPAIGGPQHFLSAGQSGGPAGDVVAMPLLESLLGATDYCGCDHCRSVLSPAAYLVDLLDFLDNPAPGGGPRPLEVLLERRPDLAELALTCENTNTVQPHIDMVNEILGHFIEHDLSMAGFQGHDVQPNELSADLLAAPRHVNAGARARLNAAIHPSPLPWSADLEALRAHFRAFDTELWQVLDDLRPDESPAHRRAALRERVGFSPAETALLTDGALPLATLAGLGSLPAGAEIATLSSAKGFARRAGISYEQLAALLATRFVNPEVALIPRLERLCLSFATLKAVKAGTITAAELADLLPRGLDPAAYGGDIHAWIMDDAVQTRIDSLIVLGDTGAGDPCSFDQVELRRANPDPAANRLRADDFRRMLHFLRIWRRLGWTMPQVDAALSALMPALAAGAGQAERDAAMAVLLDRLGVTLVVMDRLKLRPGPDLDMLLACWSDLGTTGAASPYARLFLNPTTLPLAPAFADDGFGALPGQPNTPLRDVTEGLRAALGLTGDEFDLLSQHLGHDATTPLTLANVSALARHIWLSRQLKISLREFIELRALTGIDPFAAPDSGTEGAAPCLRFIDLILSLRDAGLKPTELLRLFAGVDPSGRAGPDAQMQAVLAHDLRAALLAVEAGLTTPAEPGPETLRTRMALVYGSDAAETFLGLIQRTLIATTPYDHDAPELQPAILSAGGPGLGYDDFTKLLSHGGLMSPAQVTALQAIAGTPAGFAPAIAALSAACGKLAEPLFAAFPELVALHDDFVASTAPEGQKYQALLDAMLSALILRQREAQATATLTAALSMTPELAATLLRSPALLQGPDMNGAAVTDLTALLAGGLELALYAGADLTAAPDLVVARTGMGPGALPSLPPSPPGTGVAAQYRGLIDAPDTGPYALSVAVEDTGGSGVTVALNLDGLDIPMTLQGGRFVNAAPVTLSASRPVAIRLAVTGLSRRPVLRWSAPGLGWQVVPDRHLYPQGAVAALGATLRRVSALGALAAALKLGAEEMRWLGTLPELRINDAGWFNALPGTARSGAAASPGLSAALDVVLAYARLRRQLSPDDPALCRMLAAPDQPMPDGRPAIEGLTGWSAANIQAAMDRLGLAAADLKKPLEFARLVRVMAPLSALRIPPAALFAAATATPTPAQVAGLQAALRARHSAAEWRELLKPLNDRLRAQERDAMVAHILHRFQGDPATRHIDTANRLFEFFLIDPMMQPCFETSRIRAALSSVQLFVDRVLMNLEPRVPPAAVRPERWEWMKRYRVWEANRKVFLWPENWLEPELRDDQSPAFREVMGSLLQSDITEDAAAQALGNYLTQLDEIAKLEPCGMFLSERSPGIADDVTHVIARSHGAGRRYFHRTREGGTWTPWQPIKLDIQDTPIIPVIWRDRLFAFWLTVRVDPLIDPASLGTGSSLTGSLGQTKMGDLRGDMKSFATEATKVRVSAILNWSEKRGDEWLPPRASDPERPTELGVFAASGSGAFQRANLRLSPYLGGDYMNISISGAGSGGFTLFTTHGAPVRFEDLQWGEAMGIYFMAGFRTLKISHATLTATYSSSLINTADETRRVIATPPRTRLFEPVNAVNDRWHAPFLIEDSRHVFYVRSHSRPVTISEAIWVEPEPGGMTLVPIDFGIIHEFVETEKLVPPDPLGPIARDVIRDIERFVGNDPQIHTAFADGRTVKLNGVEIGLAGKTNIRQR